MHGSRYAAKLLLIDCHMLMDRVLTCYEDMRLVELIGCEILDLLTCIIFPSAWAPVMSENPSLHREQKGRLSC